ncbi:MAG: response regulator [Lachnospiraceae bacterium]|nr:response regulator [Lachnospiraceae bacterium]
MENQTIVVITEHEGVVVRGIVKKLQDMGNQVVFCSESTGEISRYASAASFYLFYLSETITENAKSMNILPQITKLLIDQKIPALVIGEEKHLPELLSAVPDLRALPFMKRPVDIDALVNYMNRKLAAHSEAGGMKRILIVDDDPAYAKIIREWMKDLYHVDMVSAGMHAITYLTKNDTDLILLDYEMPVVNGAQVLQMLRSDPNMAKIPVIFLTGVGTRESVEQVMALKPQGYILKTVSREDLLKKVEEFFAKNG